MAFARASVLFSVLSALAIFFPVPFSDQNRFLLDFMDNDLLSVLGFIAAVTLASISSLHIQVIKLCRDLGVDGSAVERRLFRSAVSLILLFGVAVLVLVLKPLFVCSPHMEAAFNCVGLFIVYLYLEMLLDIVRAAFKVGNSIG